MMPMFTRGIGADQDQLVPQGEATRRCDHIQLVVELLRSGLAVPERKFGERMGKANKGMTRIDHLAELLEKLR